MQDLEFKLIPYPANNIPNIDIGGFLNRVGNQLSIFYGIKGDIDTILLPQSGTVTRQNNLWQFTCFEFFFAIPGLPEYWEVNMSPSGAWNFYHMDAYRRVGFREEEKIQQLPFDFQKFDAKGGPIDIYMYLLEASLDLNPILPANQTLQIGITSIIQTKNGDETYWALVHPGQQADFHLRESFILSI